VLDVRGLAAGRGGVSAVRALDLHVEEAEVVCLLGPNGAGKTTTLLTIAGVLPAIAGSVAVLGAPVPARRPHALARRGLAFVPEDHGLFPGLTVAENLRLAQPGRRSSARRAGHGQEHGHGQGHGQRQERSHERVLDDLPELRPLLDRRCGLLSGGEQQLAGLAKALVARPRLLLVDELSLGLSPNLVARMLRILRREAAARGMAALVVEQQIRAALEWSDRAYVLAHGELVLADTASVLAARVDLVEQAYLGRRRVHPDPVGEEPMPDTGQ
jgi:branched-chain amino acid transport system ATP-binding protein